MRDSARLYFLVFLAIGSASPVFAQEQGISFFAFAGKGASGGNWKLRGAYTAGTEFPINSGFSIPISVNYLEFPRYVYSGGVPEISLGTKTDISIAAHVKYSPAWLVSPSLAGGVGVAFQNEPEIVRPSVAGSMTAIPARTGVALYYSFKLGVEIFILKKLAIGANFGVAGGPNLYSDNFSGQAGIRFWL
jgi:hypothetical protein